MKIPNVTIQQLLEAGVHLGHKTLRWNPKMKKYIFGKRDSIHIIDLTQTLELTKVALQKVYETISNNGKILFVSTKKQASEAIAEVAKETDQYFVNYRWLGGMLTNWGTISNSIKKLKKLEIDLVAENRGFTKKELLKMSVKKDKLQRSLGGIAEMKKVPDLVFIIDTNYESLAIQESVKLGIPIIAILDSNSNPDGIDFPIPGNDDARRAIDLYCNLIKETINAAKKSTPKEDKKVDLKNDEKSSKTIQELDREKLENKFSKDSKETLKLMSDIEKVKKLRELTGAGFKDCNLAIKESDGDIDKAIEILRVKGISKASKKMSRDAKEGVIAVTENDKQISLIEVNCETDFVAKNDDFVNFVKELSDLNNNVNSNVDELKKSKMSNGQTVDENLVALIAKIGEKITIGKTKTLSNEGTVKSKYLHTIVKDNLAKLAVAVSLETSDNSDVVKNFGKQLSMHIAASSPLALDQDSIDQSIIDKEQELVTEELKNSGKPDEIAKKISLGKMSKFKEENALLSQAWVMEPKKKVQDIIKELSIPDLKIKEFVRFKIGE
jgi:ribosomal protein S2/translation elongation factor Ts